MDLINIRHSLDDIEIIGGHEEEVKDLLHLLPETIFPHASKFSLGSTLETVAYKLYAQKQPSLGERGIMIVAVNEHLYGNKRRDNPAFYFPKGSEVKCFISNRTGPLTEGIYAAAEFSYKKARYLIAFAWDKEAIEEAMIARDLTTRNNR